MWKKHITDDWDYRTNSHTLWKTLSGLSNKKTKQQKNTSIQFNNKTATTNKDIAQGFTHQFTNTTTHKTEIENRQTMRAIHKLQTTEQTKLAIKNAATNKSTGPDGINIQHLKHLGERAIKYLTDIYNIVLNTNNIPDTWKLAKIIPIHKRNKPANLGTSYRQISLLSPIAKTLEKIILPCITTNIPNVHTQKASKNNTPLLLHYKNK